MIKLSERPRSKRSRHPSIRVFAIIASLLVCMQANANSFLDTTLITITAKSTPLAEVLTKIKEQCSCDIFYVTADITGKKEITIDLKSVSVQKALDDVLKNTGLTYKYENNSIVISPTPTPIKQQPQTKATDAKTQQNKIVEVTGVVVESATNEPLAGIAVQVKGLLKGVVTDEKGNFSISVEVGQELVFTCLGMKPVVRKITSNTTTLKIALEDEVFAIGEVVVTGIFEREANTYTGSVLSISKEELKRVGNSNVLQSLKNLDPSVFFTSNLSLGSDPNAMPSMAIRGETSIMLEETDLKAMYQSDPNAPLFVLDGFEVSMQKIIDLDMDRVESLTILKDASAKAIYGAKAANGVIVIELKKNPSSSFRLTYNGSLEIQAPDLTSYNLANSAQKLEIEKEFGMYDDPEASFNSISMMKKLYNQKLSAVVSGINTDWMAKPLQLGVGTKHGVSVELGDSKLKAIVDLSYNKVTGVMKGSDRTNIAGAVTLSYRHNKFLFRNQLNVISNESNDSKYGSFSEYARLNPYYTPYDQYGNISKNIIPQLDAGNDVFVNSWYRDIGFIANPLYNAKLQTLLQKKYIDVTNNFDLQWYIVDGIKATARFGLTEQRSRGDNFLPADHLQFQSYTGEMAFRKGSYDLEQGEQSNMSGRFDLQFNREIFPKNYIYANAGFDMSQKRYLTNLQKAEGFPSDKMNDIIFARQYVLDTKPTGREQTTRDLGYYISLNYSFDSRINVDGTFRQSASSQYGANSRWGAFWSMGVSWNMNKESWFNNSDFTQFRLRATTGSTGSQSSAAYNAIASYHYFLDRTYEGFLGSQLLSMKNETLKWQQKNEQNYGIDVNYKNRLSLTLEYYNAITNNAVNPLTLVPSTGFNTVQENIGKVRNRGFDMRASYVVWQRPAERSFVSVALLLSRNKNTLSEISEAMKNYNEKQNSLSLSSNKPIKKYYDGVSMNAIWAMESLGIDPANGREIYLVTDLDGKKRKTYEYNPAFQVICGDALPKFHGNFVLSMDYKGFGVNAVFMFQYGGKMYNQTLVDKVENANMNYNVDYRIYTDRWRKPGDHSPYKALSEVYVSEKDAMASPITQATSRFVQDLNEIKASSFQLSYDFYRHKFVKRIGFERVVVKLNVNDLFTISSIKIERGTNYPFARTFNASLSFTL